MEKQTAPKRTYTSTRRQAQAQETRRQIAEAARLLFFKRGFDGTTINAIAVSAQVAPETVYAIFGNKKKILWYLMDISVGGDEESVRLIDRPEPQKVLHETDPFHQVQLFSRDITKILARAAPVFEVLRSAAKTNEDIAALVQRLSRERVENMRTVVQSIANHNGLREGLDVSSAADLVWTMTSPEVFLLLTRDRMYSEGDYAAWLQATLTRLLL